MKDLLDPIRITQKPNTNLIPLETNLKLYLVEISFILMISFHISLGVTNMRNYRILNLAILLTLGLNTFFIKGMEEGADSLNTIADKLILDYHCNDSLVGLLTHLFFDSGNLLLRDNNFELALSRFSTLIKSKDRLDEEDRKIVHNLWEELPIRLQEIYRCEQIKLESDEILDFKVKALIESFKNHNVKPVGRFYTSEFKQNIDVISDNCEDNLKEIVKYLFVHFDEYSLSIEDVPDFIEFLFPEKIDLKGNNVVYVILEALKIKYPKLSLLVSNYSDIWEYFQMAPLMMRLILELKSYIKERDYLCYN